MGALSEHLNPSVKMICDKSSIAILSFTTHVSLPNYHFTQSLYLCRVFLDRPEKIWHTKASG